MILNMRRDDVPHFMEGVPSDAPNEDPRCKAAERAELDWLARRGLTTVNVPFPGEQPLGDLLTMFETLAHGAPFVLGCTFAGINHSVVVHNGEIHNPNPLAPVEGPMLDGYWWLTIYSVGPNWRSPRLLDRVRGWLR
jgi:hypothetical protein